MIPWFASWLIIVFLIPVAVLLVWTVLPMGRSEEFRKKQWEKKWKKKFPELY